MALPRTASARRSDIGSSQKPFEARWLRGSNKQQRMTSLGHRFKQAKIYTFGKVSENACDRSGQVHVIGPLRQVLFLQTARCRSHSE